jgi:SAM-dependent methyltransferase
VYSEAAARLTLSELELFGKAVLDGKIATAETTRIAGVPYVTFEADPLSDRDLAFLGNLSSLFAVFELEGDLLRPVETTSLDRFDDDLITIQKYSGKTNEQFTKLLLNATVLSTAFAANMLTTRLQVLDPLCGRGTTLNQALMYGWDAAGVELDHKDVEAYTTFMSTWLKRKRLKHRIEAVPVRRNRQLVARRLTATLAANKESYKAGDVQQLEVITADTAQAAEFFRPGSFDLIVTDAPYGVQHGSRSVTGALARSPLQLLDGAVRVWASLLKPGGALGLAWNTLVASRDELSSVLSRAGLVVFEEGPYAGFAHRVDQSIVRDVIIARRA